jgi:streptomycin 6-kinase
VGTFPDVSAAFRAAISRRESIAGRSSPGGSTSPQSSAQRWLDGLPRLWLDVAARWAVDVAGAPRTGGTSVIVPVVTRAGIRAAVKLVGPAGDVGAESAALSAFAGRGAVTVYKTDLRRQALLLEWIDGSALSGMADTGAAMTIAGKISRELAGASPPPGAPRLADKAGRWITLLRDQHTRARRSGSALPENFLDLAIRIVGELRVDTTRTLTHGDLSLSNILRADSGRWVAIDPVLLVGTAANDAHTVVRGRVGAALRADDPGALLAIWTRQFSAAADVDYDRSLSLSFARFVASYYWESQHGEEARTVADLRDAARALAPLVPSHH